MNCDCIKYHAHEKLRVQMYSSNEERRAPRKYLSHEVLRAQARRRYVPYYLFYTPVHKTRSDHSFYSTPKDS